VNDIKRILDLFFNNTSACLAVLDGDFNFLQVSEGYAIASGEPSEHFCGKNYFELYSPDFQHVFYDTRNTRTPHRIPVGPFSADLLINDDQSCEKTAYREWNLEPLVGQTGKAEAFLLNTIEVTDQVNAEQATIKTKKLLNFISRTQELLIRGTGQDQLFETLLNGFVDLSESEYGFIGEVLSGSDDRPILRMQASTDANWDHETRAFMEKKLQAGSEFTNLDNLFGEVIRTGKLVIANNPAKDKRSGGLPKGHPTLHAFMGIPVHVGEKLVGMIGIANRKGGYNESLADFLQPLVKTYSQVIEAYQVNQQRLEALKSLAESEDRFRHFSELNLDAIVIHEQGVIMDVNKATEKMFGHSREVLLGQSILMLAAPEGQEQIAQKIREQPEHPFESVGRHKDGSTFPGEIYASNVEFGGRQLRCVGIRDLTDKKKSEAELLRYREHLEELVTERTTELVENESKYRTLFELSDDAIMTMNRDGYLDCNQATVDTFGFASKEEFLAMPTGGLTPPEQSDGTDSIEAASRYIDEAYRNGSAFFEWTNQRKNGETFPSEVLLKPIELDGQEIMQSIVRDITKRKQAELALIASKEEAEFANNAKSEFLARMSHELRTPMNAILGFGQLLQFDDQNLTVEQREGIGHILQGGKHLLYLIDEVLDIARVDSGNMQLSLGALPLDQVLSSSLLLIRPLLGKKGVVLHDHDDSGLFVRADEQRLKQVLVNLLSNAVKFNQPGGSVSIDIKPVPDCLIRISVVDTGQGIKSADQAGVFEPFIRGNNAAHNLSEGTGIGLTISKRLIELMEGRIGFDSEVGKGSVFWIEVPQARAETC